MNCRSSRCREVSRHVSSPALAIWITDDILTATFNRFMFRGIRHGSTVPGPLESQKRLAKRRMGLAAVGGSGADLGLVLGNGLRKQQDLRWDYPKDPKTSTNDEFPTPSAMLSWISKTTAIHDKQDAPDQTASLEAQIQRINTLEDVLEFQRENLDDMDLEEINRIAFERLCQSGLPSERLLDFLKDPNLATSGSGCFAVYMRHALESPSSQLSLDSFLDVLHQSLVLGSIPTPELHEILEHLKPFVECFGEENCQTLLASACCRIWQGVRACRVYTPEQSFLYDFLQVVREFNNDTPTICRLKVEMYRACWPAPNRKELHIQSSGIFRLFNPCHPPLDYYSVLGIHPTVSQSQILDAYTQLYQKHLSDSVSADKGQIAALKLKQMRKSYDTLIDPTCRRKYDEARRFYWPEGESTADHLVYWALLTAKQEQGQPTSGGPYRPFDMAHLVDIIDILTSQNESSSIHAATHVLSYKLIQKCGPHAGGVLINTWLEALQTSLRFKLQKHMDFAPRMSLTAGNLVSYKIPERWRLTYRILSRHTMLLHIPEHFRSFGPLPICRLLLAISVSDFAKWHFRNMNDHFPAGHIWGPRLNSARYQFETSPLIRRSPGGDAGILEFANLLAVLEKEGIPFETAMYYVFRLVAKLYGESAVLQVAEAFQRSQSNGHQPRLTQILSVLGGMTSKTALQPPTAVELLRHAHTMAKTGFGRMAQTLRQLSLGIPDDIHSDLMHDLATVITRTESLTARASFSLVHVCYTRLMSRGDKLQPSISRSLVYSCIIRPVSEGKWLSTERLIWLIRVVERVEGKRVALDVDEMAYRWRRMVHESRRLAFYNRLGLPLRMRAGPAASSSPIKPQIAFERDKLPSGYEDRPEMDSGDIHAMLSVKSPVFSDKSQTVFQSP